MDFKKQYQKIMSSKLKYIVLLGLVGVLLITLSIANKKEKISKEKIQKKSNTTNADEYVKKLENKLNKIISKIKGVGQSEVFITIENGIENIYANSEKKSTNANENFSGKMSKKDDLQKDVVIVDSNKGKQALVITQKEPTIKGVLVVCDGADDICVVEQVTNAVCKSLNIKKNRMSVVKSA